MTIEIIRRNFICWNDILSFEDTIKLAYKDTTVKFEFNVSYNSLYDIYVVRVNTIYEEGQKAR